MRPGKSQCRDEQRANYWDAPATECGLPHIEEEVWWPFAPAMSNHVGNPLCCTDMSGTKQVPLTNQVGNGRCSSPPIQGLLRRW